MRYIKQQFTVLKAHGKRALTDVIYWCKMTSVMASDDVTLLLRLKTLQIHVNVCDTVQLLAEIIQCNGGKLEEAVNFVVYCLLESKKISFSA